MDSELNETKARRVVNSTESMLTIRRVFFIGGQEMKRYHVRYQLSSCCVSRGHRSFRSALVDLKLCRRAAAEGRDEQGIWIEVWDGNTQLSTTESQDAQIDATE